MNHRQSLPDEPAGNYRTSPADAIGMGSLWHPLLRAQKLFYMNAGCVHESTDQIDQSYVVRLLNLVEGMMPLFLVVGMAEFDPAAVPLLQDVRAHNPLLFDFALKRLLTEVQQQFPSGVFEARRFFERKHA